MALKLVWRFVNSVQRARGIQNGVVSVDVDQRNISSKSNIDIYREKSRPKNRTMWHPQRLPEVQTTGPPI
jgi:hypothetical protein